MNDLLSYYLTILAQHSDALSIWLTELFSLSTNHITLTGLAQPQLFLEVPTYREGLQGFCGAREHWQNIQGNMIQFLGNRETKIYKLGDENIVSKLMKRGTNELNVWERGQFCKRTKERGPPETPSIVLFMWQPLHFSSVSTKLQPAKNRSSLDIFVALHC